MPAPPKIILARRDHVHHVLFRTHHGHRRGIPILVNPIMEFYLRTTGVLPRHSHLLTSSQMLCSNRTPAGDTRDQLFIPCFQPQYREASSAYMIRHTFAVL
jgi:hypothetical protein